MKWKTEASQPWQLHEKWTVAGLLVFTLISRLPFQVNLLNGADAVNYALALDHFDMRLHQPQPPGYPLYILLGRFFLLLLGDHCAALVWLSTVFSVVAVLGIYLAGRELSGHRVGLVAAALTAFSTLFWYLGETPNPYTADLALSALVGWLCCRLARRSERALIWVSAVMVGLAGALRLQTFVFLMPLLLFALCRQRLRVLIGAVLVAGGTFSIFFVPAVMASGGLRSFWHLMVGVVPMFDSPSTMTYMFHVGKLIYNFITIGRYTLASLGELTLLLLIIGFIRQIKSANFGLYQLLFLIVWIAPTIIVYLLIWPGNVGTILVCTPPLFLLAALGLEKWLATPGLQRVAGWGLLTIGLISNIVLFGMVPEQPFGEHYRRFYNYAFLRNQIDSYRDRLALVRELDPAYTVVYATERYAQYYLREYQILPVPDLWMQHREANASQAVSDSASSDMLISAAPPTAKQIVLFDPTLQSLAIDPGLTESRTLNGHTIRVIHVPEGYRAVWHSKGMGFLPATELE